MSFGYDDHSRGSSRGPYNDGSDDLEYRLMAANRRMEDSSFRCVRVLDKTVSMATDTIEELQRQNDQSLGRTEQRLDEMEVDLKASKSDMREVKSIFGSFVNRFSKPTYRKKYKKSSSSSKVATNSKKMQQQAQALSKQSTGNEIVDRNLDECERHLKQLKGQAYLIGHQLDESTAATLQRHNKILKNYSQEDSRTKNNRIHAQKQRDELLGPPCSKDGYNRRTEMYLKKHGHIQGSDVMTEEAKRIAIETKENSSSQRNVFSSVTGRMQSVTHQFPLVNSVGQKINLCKRRHSLILGGVIAICIVILLFFIL